MAGVRTPADFLFTYRGLLIDFEHVESRFGELRGAKGRDSKDSLTKEFIRKVSGREPQGTLSEEQNHALNKFLDDPEVQAILPLETNATARLPNSAPGPKDLRLIYRMMFASDSTEYDSEFSLFERAAHRGKFHDVEEQFSRLFLDAVGENRKFHLTEEQKRGFKRLTSDDFIELRPFAPTTTAVY